MDKLDIELARLKKEIHERGSCRKQTSRFAFFAAFALFAAAIAGLVFMDSSGITGFALFENQGIEITISEENTTENNASSVNETAVFENNKFNGSVNITEEQDSAVNSNSKNNPEKEPDYEKSEEEKESKQNSVSGSYGIMAAPSIAEVKINSTFGTNTTSENLQCWANATDSDGGNLTYYGEWYRNRTIFTDVYFNYTYEFGNDDVLKDMSVDNSENIYITGYSYSATSGNAVVMKVNSTGEIIWNITNGNLRENTGISHDNSGNVYAAGTKNSFDAVLVKYDSDGNYLWNITYDSGNLDYGTDAHVKGNYVYFLGNVDGISYDTYIAKYLLDGTHIWNTTYDRGTSQSAEDIAVDEYDNVYIVGRNGTSNRGDFMTLKFNSTGSLQWERNFDSLSLDEGRSIALDGKGGVYITGRTYTSTPTNNNNIITIKYNSSGDYIWNRTIDLGIADEGYGIDVQDYSFVYVSGKIFDGTTKGFIIKYDLDGNEIWNITYIPSSVCSEVITLQSGDFYTGAFVYNATNDENFHLAKIKNGFRTESAESELSLIGTMESANTEVGDNWSCKAIAYDNETYTSWIESENLTIIEPASDNPPFMQNVSINSTLGTNTTAENITCWAAANDTEQGNLTIYGEWYRNGTLWSPGEMWSSGFNRPNTDALYGVDADNSDYVIVAGYSHNGASNDFLVIKYDSSGNEIWNRTYDSGNSDIAMDPAVDSEDNIIIAGYSHNGANNDIYTIKYDSSGNEIWNRTYDSGNQDYAEGTAVDSNNNVIVTGNVNNGADDDFFTIKYNSSGNEIWNRTYDSGAGESASDVAVDSNDNIIITGEINNDYLTIKYDSSGNEIWNRTYDSGNPDQAFDVAVDSNDNIIITGFSSSGVDNDYYTIKYNSSGNEIWNRRYDGGDTDYAYGVDVDSQDNIIVSGYLYDGSSFVYFTIAYNSSGNHIWNYTYNTGENDAARDVAVDTQDNVIVAGSVNNSIDPAYLTIKYSSGRFISYNIAQNSESVVGTLDSLYTSPGDNWSCRARAYDEEAYSSWMQSINITVLEIPDTQSPYFTNHSNESANFRISENFTANITINDNETGYYIFSTNASGSWVNDSAVSISGTQHNASQNATISVGYPSEVCWYYWANDTSGNENQSSTYCFNVQNTPPSVESINITPPSPNEMQNLTCNYTSSDNDSQSLTPTFEWYLNGASQSINSEVLGYANTSSGENWSCSLNISDGTEWDFVASPNVTVTGIDIEPPNVTLTAPANGSTWSSSNSITFYYNVSDNYGIANCTIYINGAASSTSSSVTNNAINSFTISLSNAYYNWSVSCTDSGSHENKVNSSAWYLRVNYETSGPNPPDPCSDECNSGDAICSGNGIEYCGNYDEDECTEWGGYEACPEGQECSGGVCACFEDWFCGEWSECIEPGIQTRECTDFNSCGTFQNRPPLEMECTLESCSDGIRNQGEEGVDCGGPCPACDIIPPPFRERPTSNPKSEKPIPSGGCISSYTQEEIPEITEIEAEALTEFIRIPEGYDMIEEPFRLECSEGGYYEIVTSVPENYADVKAMRCRGTDCSPFEIAVEQQIVCGGAAVVEKKVLREKEFIEIGEIRTIDEIYNDITEDSNEARSGDYSVKFTGWIPQPLGIRLSSPKESIRQPQNPSLAIAGTPLVVSINTSISGEIKANITVPFLSDEQMIKDSIALYYAKGSGSNTTWEYIGGDADKGSIKVSVDNIREYAENSTAVFAPVAVLCENCEKSSFEKVYSSPGSRDAIILVHGLDSSPSTFKELIGDFAYNNQPVQIWTLGYSSSNPVDQTALELANYLQQHSGEFDTISLVGHSLGGVIVQKALRISDDELRQNPASYTYMNNVQRAIIIATPNEGSPGAEVYINLYRYMSSFKDTFTLFDVNSDVIKMLAEGYTIPRVKGVDYFVFAGTKTYEFNFGFFKVSSENLFGAEDKNDGIITTKSAQSIGGDPVDELCTNYWEIQSTHTDIIDDPLARKFIEKIISESIAKDKGKEGLLGYNQYVRLPVTDCSPEDYYFVIGRRIKPEDVCDPCNCGDRICGLCESEITCPEDCGFIYEREIGPVLIYLLMLITFIVSAAYTIKRYINQVWTGVGWIKAIAILLSVDAIATAIYFLSFRMHLWIVYFSIAYVAIYLAVLEIWIRSNGLYEILWIKKRTADAARILEMLKRFNRALLKVLISVFFPFRHIGSMINWMFTKRLDSRIEELNAQLEKLKKTMKKR